MASNYFGNLFRFTSWGESHGSAIGVVIDGFPAGVEIDLSLIQAALDSRKPGFDAYSSPRKEQDELIKDAYREKPPLEYKFGSKEVEMSIDSQEYSLGSMEEILINNKKYFNDFGRIGLKGIRLLYEELKSKSN